MLTSRQRCLQLPSEGMSGLRACSQAMRRPIPTPCVRSIARLRATAASEALAALLAGWTAEEAAGALECLDVNPSPEGQRAKILR